jgi:DNA polymerase-3 subunit delta'
MAVDDRTRAEIVGHQWVLDLLRRSVEQGRSSHAYLLTGPAQVGKLTVALTMARILLCDFGRGCGTCRQCQLTARGAHPDLSVLELPVDRRTIPIKDVHDFCQGMALRPLEAAHKVYIIRDADDLAEDGANALLKTIEEPPMHVTLILTAPAPSSLLETIVSRCQLLALRPVAIAEIRQHLVDHLGVEGESAEAIARASEGRPGWAILAAQHPEILETRERRAGDLLDLLGATRLERLQAADALAARWSGHAGEVRDALAVWADVWRDALLHGEGLEAYARLPDVVNRVVAVARALTPADVNEALAATLQVADALERNANPRLALERYALHLPRARNGAPQRAAS